MQVIDGKVTKVCARSEIFSVVDSGAEAKFQKLASAGENEAKYAYHGTRFYNVFSILNLGLQQHLNKQALFGEGLYFAQELGMIDIKLLLESI